MRDVIKRADVNESLQITYLQDLSKTDGEFAKIK